MAPQIRNIVSDYIKPQDFPTDCLRISIGSSGFHFPQLEADPDDGQTQLNRGRGSEIYCPRSITPFSSARILGNISVCDVLLRQAVSQDVPPKGRRLMVTTCSCASAATVPPPLRGHRAVCLSPLRARCSF